MGLAHHIWELMLERLPKGELLSFGYPDALFPHDAVPVSRYAAEVRAMHGFRGDPPDTAALFAKHGWRLTAIDVLPGRGVERKLDLNDRLPEDLLDRFDAVLDLGTGEHVFNIAQVFVNAHAALKVGGAVLHEHPLVMGNHGFWSTQPTAMLDFYGRNGCDAEAWICSGSRLTPANWRRFGAVPDKSTTVGLAVKRSSGPVRWPTQRRFLA